MLAILDEEFPGTRATDNQYKTLSGRKIDCEGHSAELIAGKLFITVLHKFSGVEENRMSIL